MVTVVQGKVCAKKSSRSLKPFGHNTPTLQTDGRTDGRISYGIGLDLTVGQKSYLECPKSLRTARTLYEIKGEMWEYSYVGKHLEKR